MVAERVGELLLGCSWVGVPFCGGCCEIAHIPARTIVANDRHRHLINLARVVSDPDKCDALRCLLERTLFHEDTLHEAQRICRSYESLSGKAAREESHGDIQWAAGYFICLWMSRSETAGTGRELDQKLSVRWSAAGGDSCVRFRSAVDGLGSWLRIFQEKSATFVAMDAFEFLGKCKDQKGHGIYCDPPFPKGGEKYKYNPGRDIEGWHRDLSNRLTSFARTRVVCRFHDHPLVRDLYPPSNGWEIHSLKGRAQTNESREELLITRN